MADGVLPVTLKVGEQESNRFLAQWRVPKQIPPTAIPQPVFPDSCRSVGDRSMTERPGAWFLRQAYACDDGLAGQFVGIEFPFLNATIPTLLRVELLSGDRYAHMLAPGELRWRVPEASAGGARTWFREARRAVLAGANHFAGNGMHLAFALALVLLGGLAISTRLATAFTAGQLMAVAVFPATGLPLGPALAEIGLAAAVVLLAREALRPSGEQRQLALMAAAAGLLHGSGLAGLVSPPGDHGGSASVQFGLAVLGMDAVLLLAVMAGSGLRRLVSRGPARGPLAAAVIYGVGIGTVALALGFPGGAAKNDAGRKPETLQLPNLPIPAGAGATPASRRIAAPFPETALQSFVTVAPFEVRHEVLVRLRNVAGRIDVDPSIDLAVHLQNDVKGRVRELVAMRTRIEIDRQPMDPADLRVDFLTIEARGALPRPVPVPESVEDAWLGVTTVYVTERTPGEVLLTWGGFENETMVPATVTDPESSRSVELTRREPALLWTNELSEDPTPVVTAIAVEPPVLWLPLVSLALLGLAIVLGFMAFRRRRRALCTTLARVALAGAFLLAPLGNLAVPMPLSMDRTPDAVRSKRILSRLLPNVYRAFEFPTESAAYDRLALSVTGETLTEIYLEHRRAVTMEERGGARARVEAVEVMEVSAVESGDPGGFVVDAAWIVGGTVTHFGHRHFRQNRYDARVAIVPVDGHWKIRSIEVFDETRLR